MAVTSYEFQIDKLIRKREKNNILVWPLKIDLVKRWKEILKLNEKKIQ